MNIETILTEAVIKAVKNIYNQDIATHLIQIQKTRKEFSGDLTIVVFPFLKTSKKSPEQTANDIGLFLKEFVKEISGFNVVKGFLNIEISEIYWMDFLNSILSTPNFGISTPDPSAKPVLVEYSSPNTNKPLHLGHVRNNLLGYSISKIIEANGQYVRKVNLVNDRGIHICKSMFAWSTWGHGETPETLLEKIKNKKNQGDHLVGKYYVIFDVENQKFNNDLIDKISVELKKILINISEKPLFDLQSQYPFWLALIKAEDNEDYNINKEEKVKENSNTWFEILKEKIKDVIEQIKNPEHIFILKNVIQIIESELKNSPLYLANKMLRKWETHDPETIKLWKMMNSWVYAGFEETYKKLGVSFDRTYYESETYLLGKTIVQEGLQKGVFTKEKDGSVWIDLTNDGLDKKLLLRSDGTSVYMTQDLGTAHQRYMEYAADKMIYVVGNEQDYHFKVLSLILQKSGYEWAKGLIHLSYGMVELPEGKMKSREGTVVDADDLIEEMIQTARDMSAELGKLENIPEEEKENIFRMIGLGALKYFILKVDPKKNMLFDPKESIDFNGNTGSFIQYTYARIRSVIRKAKDLNIEIDPKINCIPKLNKKEIELIKYIHEFPIVIKEAAESYSPALLANYSYELVKEYNQFYHDFSILKEENPTNRNFRLLLSDKISEVLRNAMNLLGIEMPERM